MIIIWFLLLIAPITLFIHEFGHSIGAYIVKSKHIQLFFGSGKRIFSFSLGRLNIYIFGFYMLGCHTVSERDPYFSKTEQIVIALSGPVLSGVVGVLFSFLIPDNSPFTLQLFVLFNFWLCIINLIPYRIGAKGSDGYQIFKTILSRDK